MSFGQRFKQVLEKNNVTQAQFCKDQNLNKALVSRYLNGEKPSVDFIYKAINYFPEIDLDFLFERSQDDTSVNTDNELALSSIDLLNEIEERLKDLRKNVTIMTRK